jgi:membrane-bound metal-dependent hydrolase YbcI (DUF457 family)
MYIGHVGPALGAKRFAPSVAIALLVFVAYLPDWVDAALCFSGGYHNAQMLSHSIPAVLILAMLAGCTQLGKGDFSAALVVASVVISHVLLDYLTGIKPTWPGGPTIGLELYRRPLIDFLAEAAVIVCGWLVYRRSLPAEFGKLRLSTVMLALLLLMQAGVDAGRLLFPSINKC